MSCWKLKACSFIFIIILQNFDETESKAEDNFKNYRIRFKSVKCQSDNKTILTKYCYLKPVSRNVVTFNFGIKLLVPYTRPIFGHIIIYYRYGTIFRQIIDTKRLEGCAIFDGADTNPLIRIIIDMIKTKAPNLIHNCPYEGDWELKNFTLNMDIVDKTTMLFPEGIYRLDLFIFFNDSSTFNFSGSSEVRSPLKESFG